MANVNLLAPFASGIGNPDLQNITSVVNQALSAGPQTWTFTTSNTPQLAYGGFRGFMSVKIYNGGGANTAATFFVTATDGTNTYLIYNFPTAYVIANASNSGLHIGFFFNLDIGTPALPLTTITISTTISGTTTTATLDAQLVMI